MYIFQICLGPILAQAANNDAATVLMKMFSEQKQRWFCYIKCGCYKKDARPSIFDLVIPLYAIRSFEPVCTLHEEKCQQLCECSKESLESSNFEETPATIRPTNEELGRNKTSNQTNKAVTEDPKITEETTMSAIQISDIPNKGCQIILNQKTPVIIQCSGCPQTACGAQTASVPQSASLPQSASVPQTGLPAFDSQAQT